MSDDDHNKHAIAHARAAGKTKYRFHNHVAEIISAHALSVKQGMTVTEWLLRKNISESDRLAYPNARTAYEILTSPLAKELA